MAKTKTDGKDAGAALDRSPSHLLHRALQAALDLYAEETGAGAITQRQFAVLTAVAAHEGLSQTDLVKATGIDRSTLADMVARMIGKDLLGRERSISDARANTVSLTDAGRAVLAEAAPRVAAADRRILSLLPSGKRDSFLATLREMAHAADKLAEGGAAEPGAKKKKKKADKTEKAEKPAKVAKLKPAKAEGGPPKADKKKKKQKKAA